MRIVVTAAYARSLHAIALVHRLAAAGHEITAGFEVGVLSYARLRAYVRQLGWRKLISKVRARSSTGRAAGGHADEVRPMQDYFAEHRITASSFREACRRSGAVHHKFRDLNEPASLAALQAARADLVVYAGGGILRKAFIQTPRLGVLNAHGGPLPAFRGMNAGEWALFHGVRPSVTVHYIDTGVDTGPLLLERPVEAGSWQNIALGRGCATRVSIESLLEAVTLIASGRLSPAPQQPGDGRQFFVMAEPLLEVLQRWLNDGRTPTRAAAAFTFPRGGWASEARA